MGYTYDINMFKDTFEHEFTWLNGFMRNVRRFGFKPAMIDPQQDKVWTYEKLNRDANRFANALKAKGVEKNDAVLYLLPNSPQFAISYIAPQKIGAINCPANFNLAAGETALLINHNKPKVFIYDFEYAEEMQKALALCVEKPEIVLMVDYEHKCTKLPKGHIFFEDFMKDADDSNPPVDFEPHIYDEVTRLFTSGTTSLPKGVPLNNINEVLSAHDVIMHFPLNPTDVTMNMTPWFHRGGLHSGGLTPTLYAGGAVVVLRSYNPRVCLQYTEKYGVTFLIGVPAVLTSLATRQEKHPVDLSKIKGIVTMGSPLEKAQCIHFQETLTPNIFNGYGTTESFWNTFLRPYDLPEMSGTAGRSCTDDDVRVVKAYEDRKAEPEEMVAKDGTEVGEIIIKSPSKSTMCYYNNPKVTKEKYYKGFLYTGDLGTWDEKEFVTVAGRKDDMIISSGENIYPPQIEEVLNMHPKVQESIVSSIPDKTRGEVLVAYIIPEDDSLTVKEMMDYCADHPNLSKYKCPRYYRFVEELPHTATGKKQHYKIKEQAKKDFEEGLLLRK
ncbi:MAG: AMP-binding protein [Oscillospiraceae bacterium]|nr:AMP-binding protein [Oscillospiraceae bacterium]